MLSVRTWCRPTSLSAPLEAASSSSSISWRSLARRFCSARDKSAVSLLPHTSCCGGTSRKQNTKKESVFLGGAPADFRHVSALNWKMDISLGLKTNRRLVPSQAMCPINFDPPRCSCWQNPSGSSCFWWIYGDWLQVALPWAPCGLLQMIRRSCSSFHLQNKHLAK